MAAQPTVWDDSAEASSADGGVELQCAQGVSRVARDLLRELVVPNPAERLGSRVWSEDAPPPDADCDGACRMRDTIDASGPFQRTCQAAACEVTKHAFFEGLDWVRLEAKGYTPPFSLTLQGCSGQAAPAPLEQDDEEYLAQLSERTKGFAYVAGE